MDDLGLEGVKEAIQENMPTSEPPAEVEEPVTEPFEEPAAEGDTGVEPQLEITAPVEPAAEQSIPYERFKEVNDDAKYWREQARLQQEQLQRFNQPTVEPEAEYEEEDPYALTDEEKEYMSDAELKMYYRTLALEQRNKDLEAKQAAVYNNFQQQQALAQAQAEFNSALQTISAITKQPIPEEDIKQVLDIGARLQMENPSLSVTAATQQAYMNLKLAPQTPAVPPKPVVNPATQAAKVAVQRPGGVSVPTGAKPVVEGTMDIADAVRSAMNEIPKPH